MKLNLVLLLGALLLAGGCATTEQSGQNVEVPYPRSTPFDSSEMQRQAYLDGFERGYTSEMRGRREAVDALGGPYREARRLGFYAGASAATAKKGEAGQK